MRNKSCDRKDQLLSINSKYLESFLVLFSDFITMPEVLDKLVSILLFDLT